MRIIGAMLAALAIVRPVEAAEGSFWSKALDSFRTLTTYIPDEFKDDCHCSVLFSAVLTFDVRLTCELQEKTGCDIFLGGGGNVVELVITQGIYEIFVETDCDLGDKGNVAITGTADASPNIFVVDSNVTVCDAMYSFPDMVDVNCNCTAGCDRVDPFTVELSCGVDPEPTIEAHCTSIFDLGSAFSKKSKYKYDDKYDKDKYYKDKDHY